MNSNRDTDRDRDMNSDRNMNRDRDIYMNRDTDRDSFTFSVVVSLFCNFSSNMPIISVCSIYCLLFGINTELYSL